MNQTIFYRKTKEYESNGYTHRQIDIFVKEWDKTKDFPYLSNSLITLEYQKGHPESSYDSTDESSKAIYENQKRTYYSEHVEDIHNYGSLDADNFRDIVSVFAKMDSKLRELRNKGLKLENSEDTFLFRIGLLKLINAVEVEYDLTKHDYVLSYC